MASEKQIETALLTEHFTYTPISLIDDIINTVNDLVARCIDQFEAGLLAADPAALGFTPVARPHRRPGSTDDDHDRDDRPVHYPDARQEIEEGVHQLETLLESAVDRNFDKLEIYILRSVLAVPRDLLPWVRLEHYKNLEFPRPDDPQPTISPESLLALRRKLTETIKLSHALLAEKARNEALLTHLRALLSPAGAASSSDAAKPEPPTRRTAEGVEDGEAAASTTTPNLSFLTNTPSAKAIGLTPFPDTTTTTAPSTSTPGPLTTHTSFTLAQLPALRALLSRLRPQLAALPALPPDPTGGAAAAHAARRRDYVESQTRRLLERRGWDMDATGAGTAVAGAVRTPDEVRGLEAVVGALFADGSGGKGKAGEGGGGKGGGGGGGDEMETEKSVGRRDDAAAAGAGEEGDRMEE